MENTGPFADVIIVNDSGKCLGWGVVVMGTDKALFDCDLLRVHSCARHCGIAMKQGIQVRTEGRILGPENKQHALSGCLGPSCNSMLLVPFLVLGSSSSSFFPPFHSRQKLNLQIRKAVCEPEMITLGN